MMYQAGIKNTIDTGDTYFHEVSLSTHAGSVEAKRKQERQQINNLEVYDGKPLEARAEHSRWIVDCPNCDSAEFYFEDNLFMCSLCNNSNVEGKVYKVKTPKDRKNIEVILGKRPIKNRHWREPETVKDLENENLEAEVI